MRSTAMATNWLRDLDRATSRSVVPLFRMIEKSVPWNVSLGRFRVMAYCCPYFSFFRSLTISLPLPLFSTLTTTSRKSGVTLGLPESQTGGQVGGNSLTVMVQNLQVVTVSPLRMTSSVVRFDTF